MPLSNARVPPLAESPRGACFPPRVEDKPFTGLRARVPVRLDGARLRTLERGASPARPRPPRAAQEELGFTFALISDHFHPWIDRQGQSQFVWSVVGGIAISTGELRLGTGVTCPTIRIHPAIVAQAAATAADMMPGRFFLGVGTGENLNEHVLGDRWPSSGERLEMLEEAVEVMRLLWRGETCSFEGKHYRVEDARIYTLPSDRIDVVVAAAVPEAAGLARGSGTGS